MDHSGLLLLLLLQPCISEDEYSPMFYFKRWSLSCVVFQQMNTVLCSILKDDHCPVLYFKIWTLSSVVFQKVNTVLCCISADEYCPMFYFKIWPLSCVVFQKMNTILCCTLLLTALAFVAFAEGRPTSRRSFLRYSLSRHNYHLFT